MTASVAGLDAAIRAAARAEEPEEQVEVLENIAAQGSVRAAMGANVERVNLSVTSKTSRPAIKIATPNDRKHVIRVLREDADILQDELEGGGAS